MVKGREIIAEGYNEVVSHKDPTAHAEIVALRRAALELDTYRLEGCEIYTSCEPCPMCDRGPSGGSPPVNCCGSRPWPSWGNGG